MALLLVLTYLLAPAARAESDAPASPVNQVFQFMASDVSPVWQDGSTNVATAYLWVPEHCQRVRGLLILCANVPEHRLVGDPAIRSVCAQRDLGIVWCARSFMNFRKDMPKDYATCIAFLQKLLDDLAKTSGYAEIATVPWLPIGESGHLLMVDALVEHCPERCIAGVWLKNNHLPPHNREVPALVAFGTAQEWSQDKSDIRTNWNNIGKAYAGILHECQQHPNWPFTYLIDGTCGHFDCSPRLTRYVAHYINAVSVARLPADGSARLQPVSLTNGFVADLPVPGHENQPERAYDPAAADQQACPWYFDRASAEEAQAIARINWSAETQFPAFADANGAVFPCTFNGIAWIPWIHPPAPATNAIPTPVLLPEDDGITFTLKGVLLDRIPANFAHAGAPLAQAPGAAEIEWLCGCVEPLGNDQFRLALDRTWPSPIYVAVRHAGTDRIRAVVQPGQISRDEHRDGAPQIITFDPLPDLKAGTKSIHLGAKSSAGLPVHYFVRAGPAVVQGDELVFTAIPPRARLPLAVTVAAWQWGRAQPTAVQTAKVVERTFNLVRE